MVPPRKRYQKQCVLCSAAFEAGSKKAMYCSKTCMRTAWYRKNRERVAEYRRAWRRANRDKQRAYDRKYKEASSRATREWNARNPEKRRAYNRVQDAMRAGKLKREPCGRCGGGKTEAHHHDYSKPLDVTWLCKPCHVAKHYPGAAAEAARAETENSNG